MVSIKIYILSVILFLGIAFTYLHRVQNSYRLNTTVLVNTPGATKNGKPIPLGNIDTSKLNPYNRLKKDIEGLKNMAFNRESELSVEPGSDFYNALNLTISTDNIDRDKWYLQHLIDKYNAANTNQTRKPVLDDSINFITKSIMNLKEVNISPQMRAKLNQTLKAIEALEYYSNQPVTQFVLIPNTFDVNNEILTNLINEYNTAQTDKQRILSISSEDDGELLVANKKLLQLQLSIIELTSELKAAINDSLNKRSAISKAGNESKNHERDELLRRYARLYEERSDINRSINNKRLLILKSPQAESIKPPAFWVYLFSIIVGIMLPIIGNALLLAQKSSLKKQ
ncbi:MAG: hypothetical protein EOO43_15935 [Flavobacterium sp.]|nr:MAG: hypothetical protein EOO43_15935 [Flavobacterium sp.]